MWCSSHDPRHVAAGADMSSPRSPPADRRLHSRWDICPWLLWLKRDRSLRVYSLSNIWSINQSVSQYQLPRVNSGRQLPTAQYMMSTGLWIRDRIRLDPHSFYFLDPYPDQHSIFGSRYRREKLQRKCKEIGYNCNFIKIVKENLDQLHGFLLLSNNYFFQLQKAIHKVIYYKVFNAWSRSA